MHALTIFRISTFGNTYLMAQEYDDAIKALSRVLVLHPRLAADLLQQIPK